jgi:hypothetical protein
LVSAASIQSARGLAQSKTLLAIRVPSGIRASVLDCGGPPPLFPGARLWLKTQPQHVRNHEPLETFQPLSTFRRFDQSSR